LTAPFFAAFAAFLSSIFLFAACFTCAAFIFALSFASFNFSHLLLGFPAAAFYYSATAPRWAASAANGFSGSISAASSFPSSGTAVAETGEAMTRGSAMSSTPSS
jgi:hypothetical protein